MPTDGLREYGVKEAIALEGNENFFLEFGVFTGNSINYISKFLDKNKQIYGFDSFVGLRENWHGSVGIKGISFNLNKKFPKVNSNWWMGPRYFGSFFNWKKSEKNRFRTYGLRFIWK